MHPTSPIPPAFSPCFGRRPDWSAFPVAEFCKIMGQGTPNQFRPKNQRLNGGLRSTDWFGLGHQAACAGTT